MIEKYLMPGHIALDVKVRDWEDAIRAAGRLLVNNGRVEPRFVDAMVGVVRQLGPYAVIAPGIALPHARPEDGVKEGSIALVRLAEPVAFGNSVNDPVDLIVVLAPADSTSHIGALAEIADFLRDEDNVRRLRSAGNAAEVLALVRGGETPGKEVD